MVGKRTKGAAIELAKQTNNRNDANPYVFMYANSLVVDKLWSVLGDPLVTFLAKKTKRVVRLVLIPFHKS